LRKLGYKTPNDPCDTAVGQAFNSKKPFFNIIADLNQEAQFAGLMSDFREGRAEFLDVYPARSALLEGEQTLKNDEVLLVDVGGGRGHEVQKFADAFPEVKGRLIVQDQQSMIEQAASSDRIEFMAHDFFTPQPVKGTTEHSKDGIAALC
jgi:hypothetical protein